MVSFQWSNLLAGIFGETNQSELAAFTLYALAFPNHFLALVDTYDVSRVPDFALSFLYCHSFNLSSITNVGILFSLNMHREFCLVLAIRYSYFIK